ncbi:hypothetical protein BN1221_02713 [Brenneria goodwinii]|uniref:Uncharacterized protein n=1 Tax=Brenneria goodwinii TaxID=1109412 RepID=A0A0G4JWE1_9GAMM|nr:hypothetical protein BN1221_02713 [Brenneria goodwinii]
MPWLWRVGIGALPFIRLFLLIRLQHNYNSTHNSGRLPGFF